MGQQQPVPRETILIVDEDASVRNLAKYVLESRGYHVLPAQSGSEALLYARTWSNYIALAVVAVVLPDTRGSQLLDMIKQICPNCRTMLMSNYASDEYQWQNPNVLPVVEKPFTPASLAEKVREALQ